MTQEIDELLFFEKMPGMFPLYNAIREIILSEFENVSVRVQKTQISFANKHNFAFVSLPFRKAKGCPAVYIILTFGLNRRLDHPRIMESVEPYPNRWTHHVIIKSADEIDTEIKEWINEAYHFANEKRRRPQGNEAWRK